MSVRTTNSRFGRLIWLMAYGLGLQSWFVVLDFGLDSGRCSEVLA